MTKSTTFYAIIGTPDCGALMEGLIVWRSIVHGEPTKEPEVPAVFTSWVQANNFKKRINKYAPSLGTFEIVPVKIQQILGNRRTRYLN